MGNRVNNYITNEGRTNQDGIMDLREEHCRLDQQHHALVRRFEVESGA